MAATTGAPPGNTGWRPAVQTPARQGKGLGEHAKPTTPREYSTSGRVTGFVLREVRDGAVFVCWEVAR
jgi:hypothetical protein